MEHLGDGTLLLATHGSAKADARSLGAVFDDLLQSGKRTAADEQDVGCIDLQEVLVRVLTPALWRHAGHGAFDQLQQGLLHPLARYIARNAWVVRLARDLVNFIDVDDAALRFLHVIVAALQQLADDVLHILANIAGFRQRRRIGHDEGHIKLARKGLRQQGLARARGADQQDVALGELHLILARLIFVAQAFVVVVDRHGQRALGLFLADDVVV